MTNKGRVPVVSIALSIPIVLITLYGCMADTWHLAFNTIEQKGWAKVDTLTYAINPLSKAERCGISILLHTDGYEYENIAFDIIVRQDTTQLYHELREYRLNDNSPAMGMGRHRDYTLPVADFAFCDTLPTTITLVHQLDQPLLTGIRKVGIRISSPMRQPGEPVWRVDWENM